MSGTAGEVGISPVLLQAITHTLSSNSNHTESSSSGSEVSRKYFREPITIQQNGDGEHEVIVYSTNDDEVTNGESEVVERTPSPTRQTGGNSPHILQGMNEPVSKLSASEQGDTILMVDSSEVDSKVSEKENIGEGGGSQPIIIKVPVSSSLDHVTPVSSGGSYNVGNVLSAIASHLKNNSKMSVKQQQLSQQTLNIHENGQVIHVIPHVSRDNGSTGLSAEVEHVVSETVVETSESETAMASDGETRAVCGTEIVDLSSQGGVSTIIMQQEGQDMIEGTVLGTMQTDQGTITIAQVYNLPELPQQAQSRSFPNGACPICEDRISGKYHSALIK